MKTFQDRARIASSDFDPYGEEKEPFEEGYIVGATEQREIDIQRACEWLEDCLPDIEYSVLGSKFQGKSVFIKPFKQAMKGE